MDHWKEMQEYSNEKLLKLKQKVYIQKQGQHTHAVLSKAQWFYLVEMDNMVICLMIYGLLIVKIWNEKK